MSDRESFADEQYIEKPTMHIDHRKVKLLAAIDRLPIDSATIRRLSTLAIGSGYVATSLYLQGLKDMAFMLSSDEDLHKALTKVERLLDSKR